MTRYSILNILFNIEMYFANSYRSFSIGAARTGSSTPSIRSRPRQVQCLWSLRDDGPWAPDHDKLKARDVAGATTRTLGWHWTTINQSGRRTPNGLQGEEAVSSEIRGMLEDHMQRGAAASMKQSSAVHPCGMII